MHFSNVIGTLSERIFHYTFYLKKNFKINILKIFFLFSLSPQNYPLKKVRIARAAESTGSVWEKGLSFALR